MLDPDVRKFLDFMAASRPKTRPPSPEDSRLAISRLAKMADVKDEPIGRVENGSMALLSGPLAYRMYTPVDQDGAMLPGLVFFHGGGFVVGDLDTHDGLCRMLANASSCRIVSVDYRLAPEHPFPAAIEDGVAATQWVFDNAARLKIGKVAVGGDSTGANIAAVVCQLAKQAGGPDIVLQLLICPLVELAAESPPPSRLEFAEGYFLDAASLRGSARLYCPDPAVASDPRISPILAVDLSGLPPALVHTAECDPLRDEGQAYAERLRAAGVDVTHTCHAGLIHHFCCLGRAIPAARNAVAAIGNEIKAALA
jgi:acetyl esterase/lipase